jgi:hypothetical protein
VVGVKHKFRPLYRGKHSRYLSENRLIGYQDLSGRVLSTENLLSPLQLGFVPRYHPARGESRLLWLQAYCNVIWNTFVIYYTGRFIMFSVITNIYNKITKRPTLMVLFTATGKQKKCFWQSDMFDVCTTGDTEHIDTIFKFLPHTRQHGFIDILHFFFTRRTCLVAKKNFSVFLWLWTTPLR